MYENSYGNGAPYDTSYSPRVPTGKYAPLSAWAYFGYSLLFSIPFIGFICLIVFSFVDSNINRRSFARSYWCRFLVTLIIVLVLSILAVATGATAELAQALETIL